MVKKGIKEIRDNFTQYLKMVKRGEEIVVTERGKPVALLKPIPGGEGVLEKLESAAMKGLVRLPQKEGNIPAHKKIKLTGKPLTEVILEDRETEW
ncbi:MAG: type II toxin-antitoxin system prevent-host-death family antitoxin [Planctomycetes bacterium]|uniref:type II toxin-antitoxin system Phd/YefM family antitoxin n=1 Tax=Candidatus Wunengus sp. YC65 TaxID=3367701 RepID=UPI001D67100A|nr:type II toxin-antitoxin system prevent-host-death family antitoxin [Planctomycetota bacterium]MBI5796535.1 type II toxin-antitoxin system prevent-host-death family antitoxin [Planctomycetota bacterium]